MPISNSNKGRLTQLGPKRKFLNFISTHKDRRFPLFKFTRLTNLLKAWIKLKKKSKFSEEYNFLRWALKLDKITPKTKALLICRNIVPHRHIGPSQFRKQSQKDYLHYCTLDNLQKNYLQCTVQVCEILSTQEVVYIHRTKLTTIIYTGKNCPYWGKQFVTFS